MMTDDAGAATEIKSSYGRILHAVATTPWAIQPEILAVILDLVAFRAAGGRLSPDEIESRIGAKQAAPPAKATTGAVAILGLRGIIAHRASAFDDVSAPPGTSTEMFSRRFREALANPDIGAILIDVQSPGGSVDGVSELAEEILRARGDKPIVAVANAYAASAAYWIASAADELVVTPSGEVGSIGIFAAHTEFSRMDEAMGIKTTLISAGKFKVEGNPFEPLTEEARDAIQERVDEYYGMFINAVAKGRGIKASDVRSGFGQGRMVGARQAVAQGMADRVDTFDNTLARLIGGRSRRRVSARHVHDLSFI